MIREKLMSIQSELKAPKNQYNKFGKYKYRNAEGICEAVKPLLKKNNCCLTLTDSVEIIENGYVYVVAKATLMDNENTDEIFTTAYARESLDKAGMSSEQITGSASSYARKYALNGLFLLDDTRDEDSNELHDERTSKVEEEGTAQVVKDIVSNETLKKLKEALKRIGKTEKSIKDFYGLNRLADISEETALKLIAKADKK